MGISDSAVAAFSTHKAFSFLRFFFDFGTASGLPRESNGHTCGACPALSSYTYSTVPHTKVLSGFETVGPRIYLFSV